MNRNALQRIALALALAGAFWSAHTHAGTLEVRVTDARGQPAEGIGIVVDTVTPAAPSTRAPTAVIDQHDEQFAPRVLIVRRGTEVAFPNTDRVQHHVYSFSAAKQFELPLYRGNEHPPVTFDRDGIVVLGCNIHDLMVGYVLVVDSPHFGFTDRAGRLTLSDLPNESVEVTAWHPDLRVGFGALQRTVELHGGNDSVVIGLERAWQPREQASLTWNDY